MRTMLVQAVMGWMLMKDDLVLFLIFLIFLSWAQMLLVVK